MSIFHSSLGKRLFSPVSHLDTVSHSKNSPLGQKSGCFSWNMQRVSTRTFEKFTFRSKAGIKLSLEVENFFSNGLPAQGSKASKSHSKSQKSHKMNLPCLVWEFQKQQLGWENKRERHLAKTIFIMHEIKPGAAEWKAIYCVLHQTHAFLIETTLCTDFNPSQKVKDLALPGSKGVKSFIRIIRISRL